MVDDRLTDGRRIAELLASELDGLGDALARVAVTDANRDVVPTPDGALAYRIALRDDAERTVAEVFVQPDRVRVEFVAAPDVAAAATAALRVRPKAVRPPRTLVFVEDGTEVKRVLPVFETVVASLDGTEEES
jgi:hypothetical protein